MGSSSKKSKDKDRKRRHRSRSNSLDREYKEKKHKHHKRHHKDKKKEKAVKQYEYESDSSDVVEVIPDEEASTPPPPKIQRTQSPEIGHGQSVESLSIEETNKLRAKLGLKPLNLDHKLDSRQRDDGKKKDDLGEFYHKPAENISTKHQQEKIKDRLTQHREKRHVEHKLSKVKLLGDGDSDDDDAVKWIEKNRKISQARKDAEKREKMLEELDAQFGVSEVVESEQRLKKNSRYTEKHLKGLEVQHDTESFKEGQTVVLTLKDKEVLDEDGDVLVNVNMVDDERYKKNVENKKQKPEYNPYDVEEVDEFGNLKAKALLSKYDEEIEGRKLDSFRIGFDNAAERRQVIMNSVKEKLANKRLESLQMPELKIASDYYSEQELAKFKKPKKKIKKLRTKQQPVTTTVTDQEGSKFYTRRPKIKEDPEALITDDLPEMDIKPGLKIEDDMDDVLEKALHKARKLKQKESLVTDNITPTKAIKEETEEYGLDSGTIVLNTTAEFCRTLGDIPTYGKSGNREDTEDLIDYEKDPLEDVDMEVEEDEIISGWNAVDPNRSQEAPIAAPFEVPILDEEPDVGSGVGAALKLAMSKGYLEKEDKARPSNSKLAHLQAQHYSIEDKSYGEEFDRGARRERYAGPIMEFKERDAFKPNVKLEYIDDDGHVLNAKEAFRYLSHKFHGKGPGKNKVEKRIKKQQQEGLMKKMSSTDTPLGTLNMLQAKQKEMQSPFIVLSGGKHTHSTTIAKPRN